MKQPSANGRVFWSAAVAVIVVDFLTKRLAEHFLVPRHVPHQVIGDFVRFTLAYNPGAAFSMYLGMYSRFIFGAFALIALYVVWRLYRETERGRLSRVVALALIWGGAAGNLVDRLRGTDGVVDFIDIGVGAVRFWTFNVADSAVTVGAILLGWVLWQEDRRAAQAARAARQAGRGAGGTGAPAA